MVRLGAWAWDRDTGEEFRVGAGLAEPYPLTWCAIEYFETSGSILRLLFKSHSPNAPHRGRTLLHHAVLCGNAAAVRVLVNCGANPETPVETSGDTELRSIHLSARYGLPAIIQLLVGSGCDVNSKTEAGDTALMISARHKYGECVKVLAMAGADFGLMNKSGHSVVSIAGSNKWCLGFEGVVLDLIRSGVIPNSSNASVFSPLLFVARAGDAEALKSVVKVGETVIDYQDEDGFSAAMFAAMEGHVEAFRVLVYAGADVKLFNKWGDTVVSLSELKGNRDAMEKVMLEYAVEKEKEKGNGGGGFYALHCAARRGDVKAAELLTGKGYDVNVADGEGYTPLMWAAKEGQGEMCEFLIACGAECEATNERGETAVTLARGDAGRAIKDELACRLVKKGGKVKKHTKGGKGKAHRKELRMVEGRGVLSWGNSGKRNVVCKEVEVGGSLRFRRNRKGKEEEEENGLFRVVTTDNKEFHFVCQGGLAAAELWVRGITLVTRFALCGTP